MVEYKNFFKINRITNKKLGHWTGFFPDRTFNNFNEYVVKYNKESRMTIEKKPYIAGKPEDDF